MKIIINENSKLLGFERKMRLLKKRHKIIEHKNNNSKYTNKELLDYAASRLASMGLKNI